MSPIHYLLFIFITQLVCVFAFQFHLQSRSTDRTGNIHVLRPRVRDLFPSPATQHQHNLNVHFTVMHSNSNGSDGRISKRRASLRRNRRLRRHHTLLHPESHVTAAGAESIFSLSWRPFAKNQIVAGKSSSNYNDLQYPNSQNLPEVDCSWACDSNTEQIQLQQMKYVLRSEMKMITDKKLHELYPDVYSDLRLLRFLRKSKERDVKSAAERYRSFLQWRQENDIDCIRKTIENCSGSFTPTNERLTVVATYFPMNFHYLVQETDEVNDGVKPAILNVGEFDTRGITEKILAPDSDIVLQDFLNYWIFLYESIHLRLYQQSIQLGQMTFLDEVCDLSGLGLKQFSPSFVTKVMPPWLKMTQAHYPETTRRIFILHPPAVIKVAWKLVTPLLSQGTIDKIRFVRKLDGSANDFVESGSWMD